MSLEKVRQYFARFERDNDILEFDESSATVELAAQAVGVDPARIAKTLAFKSHSDDGCLLIVTAGDARVDNRKFKDEFEMKATMPAPEDVLELTGHAVGGVCPFAVENEEVKTYLDVSLKRFDSVYPAAGSGNSAIELTCEELFEYAKALGWVDVCKDWEQG